MICEHTHNSGVGELWWESSSQTARALSIVQELGQFYVDRIPFETLLSPADKAFRDFLARCLGPIKLVLFTNSPRTYAKRALQALKLDSFFPHGRFFSVEDVLPLCKPQEDAFAKVLEAVGSSPYETVLFEDSMLNIRAAKAMGIRTVLVRGRRRQRADAPASSFDPSVSKAFQMIDINGNGAIGRQEVTMALEGRYAVKISPPNQSLATMSGRSCVFCQPFCDVHS